MAHNGFPRVVRVTIVRIRQIHVFVRAAILSMQRRLLSLGGYYSAQELHRSQIP
jgi:hypothetical protein